MPDPAAPIQGLDIFHQPVVLRSSVALYFTYHEFSRQTPKYLVCFLQQKPGTKPEGFPVFFCGKWSCSKWCNIPLTQHSLSALLWIQELPVSLQENWKTKLCFTAMGSLLRDMWPKCVTYRLWMELVFNSSGILISDINICLSSVYMRHYKCLHLYIRSSYSRKNLLMN